MLAPRKKLWSTPSSAVDIASDFADLGDDDVVYDVGCGDGRVLIQMAAMSVLPSLPLSVESVDEDNDKNNGDGSANDKNEHQQQSQNSNSSSHPKPDQSSQTSTKSNQCHRQHHCRQFVGIEISPERADEARNNILQAKHTNQIPSHVNIEIICANALDTTLVDYSRATVIFLYLVPRGLRLIKEYVWPGGDDHDEKGESESESASTTPSMMQSKHQALASEPHGELVPGAAADTTGQTKPNERMHQSTTTSNKRPRRIITYMAPFENTPHMRKELCRVEHQEGAAWPVYLYHVNV